MTGLLDRKWFLGSIVVAIFAIGVKVSAESHASKGAVTIAKATQDIAEGRQHDIPDQLRRDAEMHGKQADYLRTLSFWLCITGAVFLVLSLIVCEPVKQNRAVPFLVVAILLQFLIV
jgi:hypothetical protein